MACFQVLFYSLSWSSSCNYISICLVSNAVIHYCHCLYRWSGGRDDKYFARMGKNVLSVYETETFSLVDKKSLKVENIMDFCWSPTDPIIALFVPEMGGGNQPARVRLCFFVICTGIEIIYFFIILNGHIIYQPLYLFFYIFIGESDPSPQQRRTQAEKPFQCQ